MAKAKRKAKASTKRTRRSQEEMQVLRAEVLALVVRHQPVSVRQAFYLAVSAGLVEKTEQQYEAVGRLLRKAREDGGLAWGCIVDHTRRMYRPLTYEGVVDALEATRQFYRRSLWSSQPARVEVWCEKETLLGPLRMVSDTWDVPIYPCKGYPSLTFLHDAAEDIAHAARHGKRTHILYVGDYDPSGLDIEEKVVEGLRRYAPRADIQARRLAVTEAQIGDLSLPTRPTKTSDSRAKNSEAKESVEVEAIPPPVLRAMVVEAIEALVDQHELAVVRVAEEDERKLMGGIATLMAKDDGLAQGWVRNHLIQP